MKLRTWTVATILAMVATFGGGAIVAAADSAPAAAARPPTSMGLTTPCQVTLPNTTTPIASTCVVKVTSVQIVNGVLTAFGTIASPALANPVGFSAPLDPPAACNVLSLTLGPLHLDLLGLVIDLNQVNLNITAVPGPGNLLGNLLCSVAHLLDNNSGSPALGNLLNLVNGILGAL